MRRLVFTLAALLLVGGAVRWPTPARGQETFPDKARASLVICQDAQRFLISQRDRLGHTFPVSIGWPGVRRSLTLACTGVSGAYCGSVAWFSSSQEHGHDLSRASPAVTPVAAPGTAIS